MGWIWILAGLLIGDPVAMKHLKEPLGMVDRVKHPDLQTELRHANFANANHPELPDFGKSFARAVQHMASGDPDRAMALFEELSKTDSPVKNQAEKLLLFQYKNRDQWGTLEQALKARGQEVNALVSSMATLPTMELTPLPKAVTQKLGKMPTGIPTVDVVVAGEHRAFVFDTGALSLLSESWAKELGANIVDQPFPMGTGTSKKVMARAGSIPSLEVGQVAAKNLAVVVIPDEALLMEPDGLPAFRVDAILGWNLIAKLRCILDDSNKTFSLSLSNGKAASLRNLIWDDYPGVILAHESGQRLIFMLDTGARTSRFREPILSKIDFPEIQIRESVIGGVGGKEKVMLKVIKNMGLVIGQKRFRWREALEEPQEDFIYFVQDGVLGSDLTQGRKLVIDFKAAHYGIE